MGENQQYIKTIDRALEAAQEVLVRHFNKGVLEKLKDGIEPVTQADTDAQKAIMNVIQADYNDHHIISEELKGSQNLQEFTWIIDPLDGTSNFVNGIEFHATAIALFKKRRLVASGINLPQLKKRYLAGAGEGAKLNGKTIRVGQKSDLRKSLVVPAIQTRDPKQLNAYRSWGFELMSGIRSYRSFGSAAMHWAYIAEGKLDGVVSRFMKTWDASAGVLLVREAQGCAWTFEGKDWEYGDSSIIAGNENLARAMYNALRNTRHN